ncbi:hypothetical protein OGAPHI_007165 [Ogataea philodendri]|uniref:Uncharacterized protein n=1 Tax=Ogataea philodendri TaxID=1378263 RepID=A0A9P8NW82_9ASCO|nr:uncharacterized protein OGAPHI_007165 [Ogataea philodendri]KAH3660579.1 hypothetical protein OGAPHI_007165 [Ogataea philodendri]
MVSISSRSSLRLRSLWFSILTSSPGADDLSPINAPSSSILFKTASTTSSIFLDWLTSLQITFFPRGFGIIVAKQYFVFVLELFTWAAKRTYSFTINGHGKGPDALKIVGFTSALDAIMQPTSSPNIFCRSLYS